MDQAIDVLDVLADRLWAIFEAQSSITTAVLPANRNKGDEVGRLRDAIANLPADRRRMEIGFERGECSLFERGGFANETTEFDPDDDCDFSVVRAQTAIITYREPLPQDPGAHAVHRSIVQSIFLAGPTLGLAPLIPGNGLGKLTWEERPTRKGELPNGGRVTVYRLPITTVQSAVALAGQTA